MIWFWFEDIIWFDIGCFQGWSPLCATCTLNGKLPPHFGLWAAALIRCPPPRLELSLRTERFGMLLFFRYLKKVSGVWHVRMLLVDKNSVLWPKAFDCRLTNSAYEKTCQARVARQSPKKWKHEGSAAISAISVWSQSVHVLDILSFDGRTSQNLQLGCPWTWTAWSKWAIYAKLWWVRCLIASSYSNLFVLQIDINAGSGSVSYTTATIMSH